MPDVCGIVTGDGTVLVMDERYQHAGDGIRCHVRPLCETSIESLCEFGMEFIEVDPCIRQSAIPGTGARALCGEGGMGNEGFVAVVNEHGLVWAIFLTVSNPFYEVNIVGDCVEAMSTHGVLWRFPIARPWEIDLTYTIDWRSGCQSPDPSEQT